MKNLNNNRGITLIEIILSIALVGIIFVTFLSTFSTGYVGIINAGDRADAAYRSQQKLTDKLLKDEITAENKDITYDFGGGTTLTVNVSIIEAETEINGDSSIIKSFIETPGEEAEEDDETE